MRLYSAEKPWGDVLPRYAFLEPLFLEKKVLEIGCGDGSGAFFLKDRGAREVQGTDLEGPGLEQAKKHRKVRGVSFTSFDGERLLLPAASFDLVVNFRLSASMGSGLLDEIQRVLKADGFLVTMFQNPEHSSFAKLSGAEEDKPISSYEEFISVLQEHFPRVTVIGQTPFIGFSVGWMGAEEEDLPLEMDSVLLPEEGEDVAYYLVVCGRESLSFESQSLVQLSYRALMQEISQMATSAPLDEEYEEVVEGGIPPDLDQLNEELSEYRQAVEQKEGALQEAQEEVVRLRAENEQLTRSVEEMDERLAAMESETELGRKRAEEMQDLTSRHEDEVAEKLSWLEAARSEVEQLQRQIDDYEKRFTVQKQRIEELEQEVLKRGKTRPDGDVLVGSLKEENAGLKISLKQLNKDVHGLRKEKLDLEEDRKRLEQEQQQLQSLVGELRREIESLQIRGEQLERQHQESLHRSESLEKELLDLRAEDEQVQEHKRESEAKIEKLSQMVEQSRKHEGSLLSEREALQDELAARQEELLQVRRQLTEETARIAALEARLSEQTGRNQELEADLVTMVNRMEDGQFRDHDRQKTMLQLQKRLGQQHEALEGTREKVEDLTKELYAARKHEEELAVAVESTRESLVQQERAREAAEQELSDLRLGTSDRIRELEGKLQSAESRLAAAQRDLLRRTEDLGHSESTVEKLDQEMGRLNKELQGLRDRMEETEGRLIESTATSQRVKAVEQELDWHREEEERLKGAVQTREEELEEAQWELEHTHGQLENAREEFERIGRESAEALAAREALEQQIEQLQAKNKELEGEVHQTEKQFEALRTQLEDRESELDETLESLEREKLHGGLMSEELERIRSELRPAKGDYDLALERERTLQARVAILQQQLGELEEKTSTELSSLSEQVRRREEQMSSMTEHLAKMEEDTRAANTRAGRLEQELAAGKGKGAGQRENAWKQRVSVLNKELTAKNAQIEGMKKQEPTKPADELKQLLAERESQIGVLQRQLSGQAERIGRLLAEVTDLRSKQTNK